MVHQKLNQMLNWKLLSGSHEFPGPQGGTCINEAAIVAAGFEYKSVGSVSDLPPCFSISVGGFLISLNDALDDFNRQRLMEFVTRLVGSRGSKRIEDVRQRIINSTILEIEHTICSSFPHLRADINRWYYRENFRDTKSGDFWTSLKPMLKMSYLLRFFYQHRREFLFIKQLPMPDLVSFDDWGCQTVETYKQTMYEYMVDELIDCVRMAFEIGPSSSDEDVNLVKERMDKIKEESNERSKSKVSENA